MNEIKSSTKNMQINVGDWPSSSGFDIYGDGPTYVTTVRKHSPAEESGLRPGDQIIQVMYTALQTEFKENTKRIVPLRKLFSFLYRK